MNFELKNTGLPVWERNWRKGRWFKKWASLSQNLLLCWSSLSPAFKLFFPTVRENHSAKKKHCGAWLKFPLHLPKPHYHCPSNPTYTKAVCPDGGRRNYSGTFPMVVDGKHWMQVRFFDCKSIWGLGFWLETIASWIRMHFWGLGFDEAVQSYFHQTPQHNKPFQNK